jgi:hypothetical protein
MPVNVCVCGWVRRHLFVMMLLSPALQYMD